MGRNQGECGAFGAVRELIQARLVEQSVPSLAVAVARDGEIVWEEGFGWADREERTPATEHTMYSLASISKPITATALMLLKEQAKLELDRPANEYLGAAKLTARVGSADDATVRRVANHTSGLPLHWHFFYEDEPYRRPTMDETIRRYGNLVTPPGERHQYSNLGYGILDHILSRLSGKSYPEFMRQELFLPLGMTHASVDIGPGLERHAAARYGSDGLPIPFYDFDHPGGSAIYCSAHDLVRFGMFHLKAHLADQKALLSDETLDEMQVSTADCGGTSGYGVGWATNEDRRGYRMISHGGGMGGVATALELIPSEGIVVVALANGNTDLPWVAADEIWAALLPEYARKREEQRAKEAANQEKEQAEKPDGRFVAAPELVGVWSGHVQTDQGEILFTLEFREAGEIHARLGEPAASFRRGGLTFASAPQPWTLLNDAAWKDEKLTGRMMGGLGTTDTVRLPHHLHVDLRLRGEVLNGALIAISLPGPRSGFALGHWAELRKGA